MYMCVFALDWRQSYNFSWIIAKMASHCLKKPRLPGSGKIFSDFFGVAIMSLSMICYFDVALFCCMLLAGDCFASIFVGGNMLDRTEIWTQ